MLRPIPELSRAEWLVMNQCWQHGRATARQIFEHAPSRRSWSYQTVKTMLDRLVLKGYLKREKLGPLCLYQPVVARESVVSKSIDTFWDTVLGKTLAPLFAHLTTEKLSDDEIASLRKLIQQHDGKTKHGGGGR